MTIEKLPSGKYRVTQMYKGKRYRATFDHKPSQKEATQAMARLFDDDSGTPSSFKRCLEKYIESRDAVLSPSSIRAYKQMSRMYPEWLLAMNIYDITQLDIQNAVNEYSRTHSPKSTRDLHGLLASVFKMYRPNMAIHTSLPAKKVREVTLPEKDALTQILEYYKDTEYYIPISLGCLGLRRSEICALTIDDLDGNQLHINKAMVLNSDNVYVIKHTTKTSASTRTVYIPDVLAKAIRDKGYIFNGYPNMPLKALHRAQDELGLPRCRFHDLRHFYASYAHSVGMSDADILASGGWKTDNVMKSVYRHAMNESAEQKRIANDIFSDT